MNPIVKFLNLIIDWQARLISRNSLIGGAFMLFSAICIMFWLPVQLYNLVKFPLDVSIVSLFFLYGINLFCVFRRIRF